jgi:hypothetical protein
MFKGISNLATSKRELAHYSDNINMGGAPKYEEPSYYKEWKEVTSIWENLEKCGLIIYLEHLHGFKPEDTSELFKG